MSTTMAEQISNMEPRPGVCARGRAINALVRLLEVGDEADRCYACRALGVVGSPESVPALLERLRDEDVDVCVDAAEALGRVGDSTAVPALLDSLQNDPDGEVKTAVLEALGRLGVNDVHEALLGVAARRPEHMLFDDSDSWDAWWDMQLKAVEVLGRMRVARAAPVLEHILDDEEGQDIDSAVLKSLALLGQEGEKRLARRLTEGDVRGRRRAAAALAHARTPSAVEMLGRAMLDRAPEVRVAAVEALGRVRAARYLPAIALLHRDGDPQVRAAAARTATDLAAEADENALPVTELGALAADPAPEVRRVALGALVRAPALPDELRGTVEAALGDSDDSSAMAACQALAKFADEAACQRLLAVLSDPRREPRVRSMAARMIGGSGVRSRATMEGLTRAIGDTERSVRLAALSALMDLGRGWPVDEGDGPNEVVIAALTGTLLPPEKPVELPVEVGALGGEPADGGLQEETTRATPGVEGEPRRDSGESHRSPSSTLDAIALRNAEVALSLGERETTARDATDRRDALADKDEDLRDYLDIVESNERTAEWLFSRDTGPLNSDVRRLAAQVVGGACFVGALPALVAALEDDDLELRKQAAASVALIASGACGLPALGSAVEPLLAACKHSDRDLRAAAARALGCLGDGACTPALVPLLGDSDPAVRIQAIHALGSLAPNLDTGREGASLAATEPLENLLGMLEDALPGVRKAALAALATLLGNERETLHDPQRVLEKILDAGFAGDGGQAWDAARAAKQIDPDVAAERAVVRLETLSTSAERRVAIQILEELCKA